MPPRARSIALALVVAAVTLAPPPSLAAEAAAPSSAATPDQGNSNLVMVYSIQRHGARNVLPKSSVLTESEATGGPTLLPQGKEQCRLAGAAFARRYISPASCRATRTCLAPPPRAGGEEAEEQPHSSSIYGVVGTPGVSFSNWNTFSNSSALDRTIMSADAFLSGVFGAASAPVFSVAEPEDYTIRGYTRCPRYQGRLERWLESDEFRAKERETKAMRARVGAALPHVANASSSLSSWWNAYDALDVHRRFGVGDAPTAPIAVDDMQQAVDLANWLETRKMEPALASNLLGGAILADLLARVEAAAAAGGSASASIGGAGGYYRLLTTSAHYNTQLGLLSALQAGASADGGGDGTTTTMQQTDYPWRHKIPALAAVLAFELHRATTDGGEFVVRTVAQDGPSAAYSVIPLPCAVAGDAAEQVAGPGACTLERFRALAQPQALGSASAWCEACGNVKVLACRAAAMERQLAAVGIDTFDLVSVGSSSSSSARSYSSPAMVALWCAVSVAAAAALAVVGFFGVRSWRRRRGQGQGGAAAPGSSKSPTAADALEQGLSSSNAF